MKSFNLKSFKQGTIILVLCKAGLTIVRPATRVIQAVDTSYLGLDCDHGNAMKMTGLVYTEPGNSLAMKSDWEDEGEG